MNPFGRNRKKRSSARRKGSQIGRNAGARRSRNVQKSRYQVAVPTLTQNLTQRLVSPRLIRALLLLTAAWLFYWFGSADMFYIRGLQVSGNERISTAEVTAYSGIQGINIFWVDTEAVEQAIEAVPDIESATVHCNMPADCFVKVVERQALFVWRQGDAQVWIGAEGMVFPARGELPDALVLDAAGSTALRPGDRVDLTLVAAIEELQRIQSEVRLYQYSEQDGLSFRNAVGWPVRLGTGQEIDVKLDLLRSLTDYLSVQGVAPAFVDVRYPEAPYYGE